MVLTNWVDVIKVRQQLAGPEGRNLLATGWRVVRAEGLGALGKGVTPAVARGMLYGGERCAALCCARQPSLRAPGCARALAALPASECSSRPPRRWQHAFGVPPGVWPQAAPASIPPPMHAPLAGLRIGLYAPMKRLLGAEGKEASALGSKVAAGMLSGAIAAGERGRGRVRLAQGQGLGRARTLAIWG